MGIKTIIKTDYKRLQQTKKKPVDLEWRRGGGSFSLTT